MRLYSNFITVEAHKIKKLRIYINTLIFFTSLRDLTWDWYLLGFFILPLQYCLGEKCFFFFNDLTLIWRFLLLRPNCLIYINLNRNRHSSNKMAWQCWLKFRRKLLFFNNFILNRMLLLLDFEYFIFLSERLMEASTVH